MIKKWDHVEAKAVTGIFTGVRGFVVHLDARFCLISVSRDNTVWNEFCKQSGQTFWFRLEEVTHVPK